MGFYCTSMYCLMKEWARELDQRQHRGPLHGLPISIKDCIAIKVRNSC